MGRRLLAGFLISLTSPVPVWAAVNSIAEHSPMLLLALGVGASLLVIGSRNL